MSSSTSLSAAEVADGLRCSSFVLKFDDISIKIGILNRKMGILKGK
jgi:hypothetical protein